MFKLNTNDRLNRWKVFRSTINSLTLEQAIKQTVEFWDNCPFYPFFLDIENPNSWPDPWQLIYDNQYCDLAKCLGIVYTLYLSSHRNAIFPEIRTYFDKKNNHQWHIVYLCQGKYVLNLIQGEVVNKEHINQQLKLRYQYTASDLRLEQY